MKRARLGPGAEFDLIRRFLPPRDQPARAGVRVGPGDDCAILEDGLAISVDMSVEGVHFRRDWLSSEQIGYRATSAALSDLAAIAARPIGILVALAAPAEGVADLAADVMRGAADAADAVDAELLGGDLSRSLGPLVIDVTVVGRSDSPVLRSGASPGDEVWVTGELGGAGFAVARLAEGGDPGPRAFERFARPRPRTPEALWLAERAVPRAMLDLSDGLVGDAAHLAAASGVAIVLEPDAIPIDPAVLAESREAALRFAAGAGEDYELCFCAAPGAAQRISHELARKFQLRLTRIGVVEPGEGVFWRTANGSRTPALEGGFRHFGGSA